MMLDLENHLVNIQSLDEITPSTPDLPKMNDQLVWHALTFASKALEDYAKNAQENEFEVLHNAKQLLEASNKSARDALSCYNELFKNIALWLELPITKQTDIPRALLLIKAIDYVFKTLSHDCQNLSWMMKAWLPANLHTEISQLQEQLKTKYKNLNGVLANQPVAEERELSQQEKLIQLLNTGILQLSNRTSAISAKKSQYQTLLEKLLQLNNCFVENNPQQTLINFWNVYSDKVHFDQLTETLLLTDSEKVSWYRAYEYFRVNKPSSTGMIATLGGAISSVATFTNYGLLGAKLSPEVLKERLLNATELLYNQIIDKRLRTEEKSKWLSQIQLTLQECEENPFLAELYLIVNSLNEELPDQKINLFADEPYLAQLKLKANTIAQIRVADLNQLRSQLDQLDNTLAKLKSALVFKRQEIENTLAHFNTLKRLSTTENFKLTLIHPDELLQIIATLEKQLFDSFLQELPEKFQMLKADHISDFYLRCENEIELRLLAVKKVKLELDDNPEGKILRTQALSKFQTFIKESYGLWDMILRLFSRQYRQCMAQVESYLNSSLKSIEKIDKIREELHSTKEKSNYFIRNRLDLYIDSNPYGFFHLPKVDTTEQLDLPKVLTI